MTDEEIIGACSKCGLSLMNCVCGTEYHKMASEKMKKQIESGKKIRKQIDMITKEQPGITSGELCKKLNEMNEDKPRKWDDIVFLGEVSSINDDSIMGDVVWNVDAQDLFKEMLDRLDGEETEMLRVKDTTELGVNTRVKCTKRLNEIEVERNFIKKNLVVK